MTDIPNNEVGQYFFERSTFDNPISGKVLRLASMEVRMCLIFEFLKIVWISLLKFGYP